MYTGRVVRFDEMKGYGFITPDNGGEDVFVHANMLGSDKWELTPGIPVEFESADSDRGPKALSVRIIRNGATNGHGATNGNGSGHGLTNGHAAGNGNGNGVANGAGSAAAVTSNGAEHSVDDDLCDVLSEKALFTELTEALLAGSPDLTAAQVVAVRGTVLALANRHGWVEDE